MKTTHPISTCLALLLLVFTSVSQSTEEKWVEIEVNGYHLSAKYSPATQLSKHNQKAILIIAGSGATDHNGNNETMGLINNSYQMLANALAGAGYAVLRPDKRGIGKSHHDNFKMEQTTFNDYVNDVSAWVNYLRQQHKHVTVIGHSLGGLMTIQAAQNTSVDRLVALASVADSGYATIIRQIGKQPEFVSQAAIPLLDRLAKQETIPTEDIPPFLYSLFNPEIQNYLKSFMLINPREELSKINTPTLVLIGDHDVQITVEESEQMAQDLKHVNFKAITGMNHVLKQAPAELNANIATYSVPDLPLHPELIPAILTFFQATDAAD